MHTLTLPVRTTRRTTALLLSLVVAAVLLQLPTQRSDAATPITVAQAVAGQDGSSQTVRGYVVGQPTSTTTVVTSGFPSDFALALADTAGSTSTSSMVYVQIPSAFRSAWGLASNPDLMGRQIDVTGTMANYFSHAGTTSSNAFAFAGTTPDPDPDPDPTDPPPTTPGDDDDTYYADAIGLTGDPLKTELHSIISTGVTRISYDGVWDALMETDEDPADPGNVILFYSGASQAKSTNGGGVDDWNREHVWAQSHGDFGTSAGPGTDVHHLRPTDVTVNSTRGNKDFDLGGSPVAQAPGSLTDGDSFEPRDADKGDVARALFYMAVRYEGGDGFADLELNDTVTNGSSALHGRLSVLLQWNAQDPPSAFEQNRNQIIYDDIQGNRNPFIDHPEWAAAIWN